MWLMLCWRVAQVLLYVYIALDFFPKIWLRIKQRAQKNIEDFQRSATRSGLRTRIEENSQVFRVVKCRDDETDPDQIPGVYKVKLRLPKARQVHETPKGESISLTRNQESREINRRKKEEFEQVSSNNCDRRRTIVIEIAKRFEENEFNSKVHTASSSQSVSDVYFEGSRSVRELSRSKQPHLSSNKCRAVIEKLFEQKQNEKATSNCRSASTCNISQPRKPQQLEHYLQRNGVGNCVMSNTHVENEINCNGIEQMTSIMPGKISHSPVESVEEILAQQRFSRSLSTYSITDLLENLGNVDDDVDKCFNNINM